MPQSIGQLKYTRDSTTGRFPKYCARRTFWPASSRKTRSSGIASPSFWSKPTSLMGGGGSGASGGGEPGAPDAHKGAPGASRSARTANMRLIEGPPLRRPPAPAAAWGGGGQAAGGDEFD